MTARSLPASNKWASAERFDILVLAFAPREAIARQCFDELTRTCR